MKNLKIILAGGMFLLTVIYATGCKTSQAIASKSGAQIWGENCVRCHNTASPETFSDTEWEVATTHMQIRANLTVDEANKVVAFLQSAN
jgi:nitrate/TMAO reductase-like tetraheme cytochrome c subunit